MTQCIFDITVLCDSGFILLASYAICHITAHTLSCCKSRSFTYNISVTFEFKASLLAVTFKFYLYIHSQLICKLKRTCSYRLIKQISLLVPISNSYFTPSTIIGYMSFKFEVMAGELIHLQLLFAHLFRLYIFLLYHQILITHSIFNIVLGT